MNMIDQYNNEAILALSFFSVRYDIVDIDQWFSNFLSDFIVDSSMASTASNRTQRKRTTTKIFSLSESDPYALVFFYLNDQYKIVKYADVLSNKEGEVELRNADIALLMMVDLFLSKKNRSAFQLSFFLHLGDLSSYVARHSNLIWKWREGVMIIIMK